MNYVICSHCGRTMPDSCTRCPQCGAAIKNQHQGAYNPYQKRFIVWFVLLTIVCIFFALLLPR